MSTSIRNSSISPVTILTILVLALYCGGFVRVELKIRDQNKRIEALEALVAFHGISSAFAKQELDSKKSNERKNMVKRSVATQNTLTNLQNLTDADIIKRLKSLLNLEMYCAARSQFCPPAPQGPPGPRGERGKPGQSAAAAKVIMISPQSLTVNQTDTAVFHCIATGNPRPKIVWSKLNGSLTTKRIQTNSSGQLVINGVQHGDRGTYMCEAVNILGMGQSEVSLLVNVAPRVTLHSRPVHWQSGMNGSLFCHVTGSPRPKVTWSKSPGQLPTQRLVIRNTELRILNIQKRDSGLYTCRASNLLGTQVAMAMVVVHHVQLLGPTPQDISKHIGQSVQMNCSVKSDPQAFVTWKRKNGKLPSGKYRIHGSSLIIKNLATTDSGSYICSATTHAALKGVSALFRLKVTACSSAPSLGAANGGRIPDSSFSATSNWSSSFQAKYGRLRSFSCGWSPKSGSVIRSQYLEIDLGSLFWVCGVATQGENNCGSYEWTTKYKISLSLDSSTWNISQWNGSDKIFKGNTDCCSVVKNVLPVPTKARYIRFIPTAYHVWPVFRVDVFGRDV